GIELHAEAALVIPSHRLAETRNAARGGIAIGARRLGAFAELLDDVRGHGKIGIAHAEIDDVHALIAHARLQAVHLLEDIRREATGLVEIGGHRERLPTRALWRRERRRSVSAWSESLRALGERSVRTYRRLRSDRRPAAAPRSAGLPSRR